MTAPSHFSILVFLAGLGFAVFLIISDLETNVSFADPATGLKDDLDSPYTAPEITGISEWINTDAPLSLSSLRGKVVLIDFWTYSCINCIRTFPYIRQWHDKYKDDGLVIIGVHSPEFVFETKTENVLKAARKYGLAYPIALDNNRRTWSAFKNRYWPAHYLIDREGRVVYTHFGEGKYNVTEHNIRTLLGLEKSDNLAGGTKVTSWRQTPETYLGSERAENIWTGQEAELPLHHWTTSGAWRQEGEYIVSGEGGGTLSLRFSAKKVFLVLDTADGKPAAVALSLASSAAAAGFGKDAPDGTVTVKDPRLYELLDLPGHGEGILRLTSAAPGLRAYAFTFESEGGP